MIARLVSNNVRRSITPKEKSDLLDKLGQIFLEKGWSPGNIAYKLTEETGMSYRWVMKYLPKKYKDHYQSARRTVAHHATQGMKLTPIPAGILEVKSYVNTEFVNICVRKDFYNRFVEKAEKLGTKAETLIYNALIQVENIINK